MSKNILSVSIIIILGGYPCPPLLLTILLVYLVVSLPILITYRSTNAFTATYTAGVTYIYRARKFEHKEHIFQMTFNSIDSSCLATTLRNIINTVRNNSRMPILRSELTYIK
ncbi:Uncharacterised protein [Yersinia aldovae]|uniref:Uncharacterized protein n=1 Tax=Yersinia aldovae TaxID=29483 RepID=A0A0T9UQA4_YERAL|nr:Uncharacterised protein [Yersinia aldovae]